MLKWICGLAFMFAGGAWAQPALQRQILASMRPHTLTATSVGTQAGSGWIVLSGPINASMADGLAAALAADRSLHHVLINSGGGDMDAALRMAAILRRHQMRLVVDGLCLSACASYLFPAAVAKSVLPSSVIAIHAPTIHYSEGGRPASASVGDAAHKLGTLEHATDQVRLQGTLERGASLYRELGLRDTLDASFARYLAHRKALFGTDTIDATQRATDCPPYQMWALNRAQLEAAGVTGIEDFWYPADTAKRRLTASANRLAPDFLYYGQAKGLEQLCTSPLPLLERVRLWGRRTITALRGN